MLQVIKKLGALGIVGSVHQCISMASSINTASLLLVAMLVSTVMAYTVLSYEPQSTVPPVSDPGVGEAELGDVQDPTATDDGSLETAALGRRGKKQRLQDRCVYMAGR